MPIESVTAINRVEIVYSLASQINHTDTLEMLKTIIIDGVKQITASQKVSLLITKNFSELFQQTNYSIVHTILYFSLSFTGLIFINAN